MDTKSSPTTYNPQERSFIKRPEQKCCAACGQPLPSDVKPIRNEMNYYIAVSEGAKAAVYNSGEETLTVGGVLLYRVDSESHKKAVAASIKKAPVVANTTTPTK